MTDDYRNGRCCAITKAGTRCTGRWSIASPALVCCNADVIVHGPNVVLCHRHRHWLPIGAGRTRFRVVHGWLGAANQYGYGLAVFKAKVGWALARWWADRGKVMGFAGMRRDCP